MKKTGLITTTAALVPRGACGKARCGLAERAWALARVPPESAREGAGFAEAELLGDARHRQAAGDEPAARGLHAHLRAQIDKADAQAAQAPLQRAWRDAEVGRRVFERGARITQHLLHPGP